MKTDTLLDRALHYLRMGLRPFPIGSSGTPAMPWTQLRNRPPTEGELVSWFANPYVVGVALITGKEGGLIAFDIDAKDGGPNGLLSFEEIGIDPVEPRAPKLATPNGGSHLYFSDPTGFNVPSRHVLPGVEVKGDRASIRMDGPGYRWENDFSDLPMLEGDLLRLATAGRRFATSAEARRYLEGGPTGYEHFVEAYEANGLMLKGSRDQKHGTCPAHDDKNPSLSVTEGENGEPVFHCHAGCKPEDILSKLGLTWADVLNLHDQAVAQIAAPLIGMTSDELLEFEAKPLRFAIPNLAIRGNITMLYATIGSGKTTLYQEALVANSLGRPFLNLLEFDEPQSFVVFDWENDETQVKRTLERLGLRPGVRGFNYYFRRDEINLDTQSGRDQVVEIALRHEATCLIFDNRDTAFPTTNELDGAKITAALTATKDIARTLDLAIVIISHEPKADYADSTAKLRGHTTWGALSDQLFRLHKKGEARFLEHTRPRGMDRLQSLKVSLVSDGEPHTGPLKMEASHETTQKAIGDTHRQEDTRVLGEYVKEHGPIMRGPLKEAMGKQGIGDTRFRNALKEASRLRTICQPEGKGSGYCVGGEAEQAALGSHREV